MGKLLRYAILSSLFALPDTASGQQPAQSLEQLKGLVAPGAVLTVFHPSGATTRGKLSAITTEELILDVGGDVRRLRQTDIRAIRRQGKDSIVNGVLIGAAIGTALGSLNYLDNDCRGDAGCAAGLALGAAVCAGAGGLIDALIRPSQLVFERAPTSARWLLRPASVSRGWRTAVQVSFRF